ncbi:hypothetical protein ACFQ1S_00525 [Kibdelosporangium lantanae]|uniref:DNA polymerase III beta sliding clamp central domain-containing protein n=1 Tax=Kibdelosporangium lantanae TaxID=1497396 RepID=A0ABW3M492_9PSEU
MVRLAVEGTRLAVRTPNARFALPLLEADVHPGVPVTPPLAGTVDGELLASALTTVAATASRDDALPLFTGVRVRADGDRLVLAATDRYRMALASPPYCSGSQTFNGNSAPSSIRQATNAVQSCDFDPSNPSVIRSLGRNVTSAQTRSHSCGAIQESSAALIWLRNLRRDSDTGLLMSRMDATMVSMLSHTASPRATSSPRRSASIPASNPSGSMSGLGISDTGVPAGASSASYRMPVSMACPARTAW